MPILIGYVAYTSLSAGSTFKLSSSGFDISPMSERELAKRLGALPDDVVKIAAHAGTERRDSSRFVHGKWDGVFVSAVTDLPLFDSSAKYDSGSGWPSFHSPFDSDHVLEIADHSGGMERIEVLEAREINLLH